MIFVTGREGEGFSGTILCYELLDAVRGPDIEETEEGHNGEPMGCCLEVSCTEVTMEGEETSDKDSPLDSFIRYLKLKE